MVEFGIDGANYAINLSFENAAELRDSLASFVVNARKTGGRKRAVVKTGKSSATVTTTGRERSQAIRDWARNQGMQVSDRAGHCRTTRRRPCQDRFFRIRDAFSIALITWWSCTRSESQPWTASVTWGNRGSASRFPRLLPSHLDD
ncbi:histone-like nucleoid-structuring protein Lsr2 [Saccharopolyspora spinosa]|uniref:histone-like nucleoid-structuring protein Lsr2 n=1 Tax=Saccharopolyspora spinosa TaxID=60894 RepID=UPI00376EBFBD